MHNTFLMEGENEIFKFVNSLSTFHVNVLDSRNGYLYAFSEIWLKRKPNKDIGDQGISF